MKKLLSTLLILMLVCSLCLALSACGDDEETGENPKGETVTLTKENCEDYLNFKGVVNGEGGSGVPGNLVDIMLGNPKMYINPGIRFTSSPVDETHTFQDVTVTAKVYYVMVKYNPYENFYGVGREDVEVKEVTLQVGTDGTGSTTVISHTFDTVRLTYIAGAVSYSIESVSGTVNVPCVHEWKDGETTTPATCTESGKMELVCEKCNHTKEKNIAALGHNYSATPTSVTPATCTADGTEVFTCDRCQKTETKTISALGHSLTSEPISTTAATCTQKGNQVFGCQNCDEQITKELDALGHSYDKASGVVTPATCTEDGKTDYVCTVCSETVTEVIEKLGHSFTNYVTSDANCTEEAYKTAKCDRCDEVDRVVLETAIGHNYGEWIEEVASTCTAKGTLGHYTCSLCNKYFDAYKNEISSLEINLVNHKYEDMACTVCGGENPAKNLAYELSSDGKYYIITGRGTCTAEQIVLPSMRNNIPVKKIAASAFSGCIDIVSITISKNITEIGTDAFKGCYKLKEVIKLSSSSISGWDTSLIKEYSYEVHSGESKIVNQNGYLFYPHKSSTGAIINWLVGYVGEDTELTLPESYNGEEYRIASHAFFGCTEITSVTLSNGVTGIEEYAFSGCSGLAKISLGESVTYIYEGAFADCTSLTELEIPKSVTSIRGSLLSGCTAIEELTLPFVSNYIGYIFGAGKYEENASYVPKSLKTVTLTGANKIPEYAFYGCANIESINYPESVTEIDNYAFYGCSSLVNFVLNGNITRIGYSAFSGCTSLTSVTIPDSVTSIGDSVFRGCTSLTSVTIPDSVTEIGSSAFYYCTSLTSVTIPDSVTSIGYSAFSSCTSLTSVTIPDSVTSIGSSAFAACYSLVSVTIPDSVTSIGKSAFSSCTSLTIYLEAVSQSSDWDSDWNPSKCPVVWDCDNNDVANDGYIYSVIDGIRYALNYNIATVVRQPSNIITANIHATITYKDITYNVTSIGGGAFSGCTSLTSVTIPDSITSIDESLFRECTNLTSITIPDSVTDIGEDAFRNCRSLTSVYITDIAKWCAIDFYHSYSNPLYYAKNLYVDNTLVTELIIPDNVTDIRDFAFYNCTNFISVTIPYSVISIGDYAFYGCSSLTEINFNATAMDDLSSDNYVFYGAGNNEEGAKVTIGKNVTKIPAHLFSPKTNSYNITIVTLEFEEGAICESIGASAFSGCTSLKNVTIPDTVTQIGENAFFACRGIENVYIDDIVAWYSISFGNRNSNPLYYASDIEGELVIPYGVTQIGSNMFYGRTSLTSVTIPDSVTSIGSSAFRDCTNLKSITIPDSVTSIGSYAFEGCTSLTIYCEAASELSGWAGWNYSKRPVTWGYNNITTNSDYNYVVHNGKAGLTKYKGTATEISIPLTIDGYEVIRFNSIFEKKTTITKIAIPDIITYISPSAFSGCTRLTSVTIPNSVTSIGSSAFYNCTSLTSVTIPDSVTSIGSFAFRGCTNLKSITIPDSVTSIGSGAFYGCTSLTSVTIPDSVTNIGSSAFYGCTSLTSVTIPDSVTNIGASAFSGCTSLTSVTIPNSVTNVGYEAFYGCTNLTSVTLPDSVTSIGYSAFKDCTSLTSVTISDSVTYIGGSAFSGCTNLTEINFNATAMNDLSKDNYVFSNAGKNGKGIKVTIGKNVTKIPDYLFCPYSSDNSKSPIVITLEFEGGSICKKIGDYAFSGCTSLTSITIPDSVTSIGEYAFKNCTKLTKINFNATAMNDLSSSNYVFYNAGKNGEGVKITIGNNVTKIPAYLFCPNSSLNSPKIVSVEFEEGSACESIGTSAFKDCTSLTSVIIPDSVTSIGKYAFSDCGSLTSVTIGESVTSIGSRAFSGCTSLTEINFNAIAMNSLNRDDYVFSSAGKDSKGIKVIIGKNVTKIPSYLFLAPADSIGAYGSRTSYAIKIINVEFEEGCVCESIGFSAFKDCTSLTSMIIPDSVTSIGEEAFYNCTSLTSITIPDSVTSIGNYAFSSCTSLTIYCEAASQPSGWHSDWNYYGGPVVWDSVNNAVADDGYIYSVIGGIRYALKDNVATVVRQPSNITIANIPETVTYKDTIYNVTSIGPYAFRGCTSLTSVTIPDSVTKIVSYAFYYCTSLTSVTIPDSVTTIGAQAFRGCTSLTSITFTDTSAWYRTDNYDDWNDKTGGTATDVTDASANATYFESTYYYYHWYKK